MSKYLWSGVSFGLLPYRSDIHIIVTNGNVTLEGMVLRQSDIDIASLTARGVSGVFSVTTNLRVIIINNQGGNIFRIIEGPAGQDSLERYQETVHTLQGKGIAETYGVDYQKTTDEKELLKALPTFFENASGPRILEVMTPRLESPGILKDFFKSLKKG